MDSYTLKSLSDLPPPFRSTFNFRYFNSLQSECFSGCFLSDINMVISAPTGSGKTVLFELCILKLLSRFLSHEGKFIHLKGTLKTIYIAPSKALVQEKLRDWYQKFGSWGINCLELTGDSESYNIKSIQEADIILTTPEKFDAVTRYRIRDGGLSFFSDIGLLLIDEVHLLNDPRGSSLEAIVSRIKMLARNPEMNSSALAHVRLLAVSATIPNIEDIAEWLMVPVQGIKRFGEEMRPVKLTTRVFGYAPAKNDFLFERRLQTYIFDILMQHSRGKSALVFCSTRKGAQEAALRLSQTAMTFGHSNPFMKCKEQQERLKEASLSCSDKQMQSCVLFGVGYHNGGLCLKDRNLIEGLFLRGDIQILCTTNTLAHGINLPAHTVIIKSTQYFNKEKGLYMEYDRSMILQMCGRAGRPPFDDTGMVIIMTRRETVHLYENLLNGCELVESQLLSCITEHLAAEIVQLTISDVTRAIEWMKCSYLYVRMKKNPEYYGVKKRIPGEFLEKHMQEICVQKANELSRHGMIWTDEYGFLLKPLEPGRLMTKYYLKFDTMKHIMRTPESCSLEDALHIICRSEEIAWIQLRRNEKKLLNDINTDKEGRLRFHILSENGKRKKRIQTREEKIFVLANDCLTGDPLCHDLSFNQDMNSICSNGCRIAKCMKEYFIYKKNYKGVLNSTLLAKCLHQRLWDDSPYLLKQLPGIGMVTAKALNSAGVKSFKTLAEAEPRRIEIVTGRKYPFGNHIKESLSSLPPKVDMKIEKIECQRQGKSKLVVTLTRLTESTLSPKWHCADMVVGSVEDNLILFHEKIRVEEFSSPYSATILVPNPQQRKLAVKADLIFEEYIGLDLHEKLFMEREIDSNSSHNRRNQKSTSTYDLPKDIYVVEDDDDNTSMKSPTDELQGSNKSIKEACSMPSFNLLDEDMDEAIETEVKGWETITEQTIFDHIRSKAKNYPVFATSNAMDSSSSEILFSAGKHPCGNQLELHNTIEVSEETVTNIIWKDAVIVSDSEPVEGENYIYGTTKDETLKPLLSRSSSNFNLLEEDMYEGDSVLENEDDRFKTVTKETIFDHIRKKAKNFPAFSSSNTMEFEPLMLTRKNFCKEQPEQVYGTDEGATVKHHTSFDSRSGNPYLFSEVSSSTTDPMEMKMLTSNVFSVKEEDIKRADKGRVASPSRRSGESSVKQQQLGSTGSNRQLCSLDTIGENSDVVSLLGFKSVFSFL